MKRFIVVLLVIVLFLLVLGIRRSSNVQVSAIPVASGPPDPDPLGLERIHVHRHKDHDALDEPVRVWIGAEMVQSATYHLERQRTEDHGDEDVAAPSEETDAANHHYGDGRKFHAFADL